MDAYYQTLICLYHIVEADVRPLTYWCSPRELILRQSLDWQLTELHLKQLTDAGLVVCRKLDHYSVCLTEAGWEKAQEILSLSSVSVQA